MSWRYPDVAKSEPERNPHEKYKDPNAHINIIHLYIFTMSRIIIEFRFDAV